jgi:hypothetical protein
MILADISDFLGNVFFALLLGVIGLGAGWFLCKKYGAKV